MPDKRNARELYDDVMKQIGFRKVQVRMLIACGLTLMMFFCQTMGVGVISLASFCDLKTPEPNGKTVVLAASFAGVLISGFFWAMAIDIYGRRKCLLYSVGACTASAFISLFMPNFLSYTIMRFITGLCAGELPGSCMTYLGEFCYSRKRSIIINRMFIFNGVAMVYCPVCCTFILKADWYVVITEDYLFTPWRLLSFMFLLPGAIALTILPFLPESPSYLYSVYKIREAEEVLNWLCEKNIKSTLLKEIEQIEDMMQSPPLRSSTESYYRSIMIITTYQIVSGLWHKNVKPLFKNPYWKHILLVSLPLFCFLMISNGMAIFAPTIRNNLATYHELQFVQFDKLTLCGNLKVGDDEPLEGEEFICSDTFSNFYFAIELGIWFVIVFLCLGESLRLTRRKYVLITAMIIASACGFSVVVLPNSLLTTRCLMLFLSIPNATVNIFTGYVSELFPTTLRAKAVILCMLIGRLGTISGIILFARIFQIHCTMSLVVMSCVPICAIFLLLLMPRGYRTRHI